MQKTKIYNIKDLKEDSENPNEMNEDKLKALVNSIEKFGELEPILVDKKNMIIDGHHRVLAYKELGKTQIPGIEVEAKDIDRRLIRQAMNKVRGTHNEIKDAEEIQRILKEVNMQDFSELIGETEDNILKLMDSLNRENETQKVEFNAAIKGKVTSWTFIADDEKDIETINKALNKTTEKNSSRAFIKICEAYL